GIGSRFWPVSRTNYPKQFLDMLGTGKSLLQHTYERFLKFIPAENIYISTHQSYINLVREQLPQLPEPQYLVEPIMRNTAPGIAYAAHKLHELNPKANMVVAPADHLIIDEESFATEVMKALECASTQDWLITLGIKPTRPDTGYGYIQFGSKSPKAGFKKVKTFTEKPGAELAKTFVQSGEFLWNA